MGNITYPVACLEFNGQVKANAPLDSNDFLQQFTLALQNDDAFANAAATFHGTEEWGTTEPDNLPELWENVTADELAINLTDFFMQDYREWKALTDRGREHNPWLVISEDESIVVS